MAADSDSYAAVISMPFGQLGVRMAGEAVCGIDFLADTAPERRPDSVAGRRAEAQLRRYLDDPAAGFNLPVQARGTAFQERVWRALCDIPPGQVRTYGELAARLGTSARAVGGACRANPVPVLIPCHRVVAREGLGGFSGARRGRWLEIKRWLLDHEGHGAQGGRASAAC